MYLSRAEILIVGDRQLVCRKEGKGAKKVHTKVYVVVNKENQDRCTSLVLGK